MMVWFYIWGRYYREESVTLSDAIKAFFISLIPLSAPLGLMMVGIFYLMDHGNKVLFRSKKAASKEMVAKMTEPRQRPSDNYRGRLF
jgi:hypothetical protein